MTLFTTDYLEYYLTLVAWVVNNGIWSILVASGVFALPFVAIVIQEWLKARSEGADEGNKGVLSSMRIGVSFEATDVYDETAATARRQPAAVAARRQLRAERLRNLRDRSRSRHLSEGNEENTPPSCDCSEGGGLDFACHLLNLKSRFNLPVTPLNCNYSGILAGIHIPERTHACPQCG